MKRIFCDFCGQEVCTEGRHAGLFRSEFKRSNLPSWLKVLISPVIPKTTKDDAPYDVCEDCAREIKSWLSSFDSAWDIVLDPKAYPKPFESSRAKVNEVIRLACESYSLGRVENITLDYNQTVDLIAFMESLEQEIFPKPIPEGEELPTITLEFGKLLKLRDEWIELLKKKLNFLHTAMKSNTEEDDHYWEDPDNFDPSK